MVAARKPRKGSTRKPTRWMAIADTHGDMCHYPGLRAALEFAESWWKPTIRIAMGDHFDLRRMRKGAGDDEDKLNEDVTAGLDGEPDVRDKVLEGAARRERIVTCCSRSLCWRRLLRLANSVASPGALDRRLAAQQPWS